LELKQIKDLKFYFQIQSATVDDSDWMEEESSVNAGQNLATTLYVFTHLQQICDPIIFIAVEFFLP
jgi:hypothetical protein